MCCSELKLAKGELLLDRLDIENTSVFSACFTCEVVTVKCTVKFVLEFPLLKAKTAFSCTLEDIGDLQFNLLCFVQIS